MSEISIVPQGRRLIAGIGFRTSNEEEMNNGGEGIRAIWDKFLGEKLGEAIQAKSGEGLYALYYNYEDEMFGDYDFLIGVEVERRTSVDWVYVEIPEGDYAQLDTEAGKSPDVVIQGWQKIWTSDATILGGERKYAVDFEYYKDPSGALGGEVSTSIRVGLM